MQQGGGAAAPPRFWQIRRRRRQAAARRITVCPPRFLDFGTCLKIINKCEYDTKKNVFLKNHFHYKSLKFPPMEMLVHIETVDIAKIIKMGHFMLPKNGH